ncbi:hypothetical protein CJ030_MR8G005355 [Morella rubra]|uniref:Uncharacterized protein n=1 Tax=Morella rubra TaxID=262757 RepID=A0A6A1UHM1_9ROSI|nr:hypothetical protein CJ030_MR0G013893 [Morella rubra]KAB1199762.1 hypothetical protein CJ030_MR0G013894 [Morella rubra]KAB1201973.1 hypothetical protein CJ030_MR8G005355 [Morella rubra]
MGSKTPSWFDQRGTYNSAGNDHDEMLTAKVGHGSGSKMVEVKAAASAGFGKAKAAATVGAHKVKSGTSIGIKWVKNQYQKRVSK